MTKQELIKNAWESHYDEYNDKGALDSNGVVQISDWRYLPKDINFTPYVNTAGKTIPNSFYPLILKGIENNNGWFPISEIDDGSYYCININDPKDDGMNMYTYDKTKHEKNFPIWFTHFRPIEPPHPKPMYNDK